MVIELTGGVLAWYIAIVLTAILVILLSMLSALRWGLAQLMPRLAKIDKAISRFGGDSPGGGAGGLDLGSMLGSLGGLIGGGK